MQLSNIDYIQSKGFEIKGRYILKRSSKNIKKVCGYLNEKNFFLFKENVYPFKHGTNYFDNSTLVDPNYIHYVKKEKEKENESTDFNVDFEKYIDTTQDKSVFTDWLNKQTNTFLNKDAEDYFDLRGIYNGRMANSVCFPFSDIDGNFVTAQIITYSKSGKRIKNNWSTNWFHSYKDIKPKLDLDLNKKYSVPVKCFFGESYLKGSENIIGIVEAPKTAVILKEIYPNIDWLATAGEQQLFGKNFEVLKDRKVILFPDAHTTSWREFGNKNGYNVCEILDIESVKEGSDIADFIFEDSAEVFSDLHEYLFSLNAGYFDVEIDKSLLDLNFKVVKDESVYFTALPYSYEGENLLLQKDDSGNFKAGFQGKHFNFFTKKKNTQNIQVNNTIPELIGYGILNANIDWHKKDKKDKKTGKLVGFSKDSFVWHLQKSYRTLKYLNPNTDYKAIFGIALNKLNNESNFSFNEVYVKRILMPLWDSYNTNLDRFKKYRDWKYKGSKQLARDEFERELNNDRFKARLQMRLLSFKDVLKEDRFILLETDLAINKSTRGYGQIKKLVKQWNEDVIGAKTLKTYLNILEIERKTKKLPLHIDDTYRVAVKKFFYLSLKDLAKELKFSNAQNLKRILTFEKNRDTETLVKNEVDSLLERILNIEPIRLRTDKEVRITDFRYIESVNEWASLHKNRGNWFTSKGQVKEEHKNPIFLSKEKLLLEKEKATEKVYSDILSWSIEYLDYLDSLKQEKSKSKVIKLSDIQVRSSSKDWYSPDEKLSLKLVNF